MRELTHHYELFGLHLAVSGSLGALPLRKADAADAPDVSIWLEGHRTLEIPRAAERFQTREIGNEILTIWRHRDVFIWVFPDDTRFCVDVAASELTMSWPEHFVIEDAVTYLVGPVLGFLLRRRGERPLHGSCVAKEGRAVLLLGPAGAGKSTLAAAAVDAGWSLIAEDVSAVHEEDGYRVAPGIGFVKLWPLSAAQFGDLPQMTPNWDKRYLAAPEATAAARLRAIFILREGERVSSRQLPARDALTHVLANLYVPYLLDGAARAADLAFFGQLIEQVPVAELTRTASFDDLPALIAALECGDE